MRLSRLVSLLFVCIFFLLSARVYATNININNYDIYYGDVDGDGRTDIYFHGKDQFILIHSDVSVPLIIQPGSFVSYRPTDFTWGLAPTNRFDEIYLANNFDTLQEDSDFYRGDFNGDGVEDCWVLGHQGSSQGGFILNGASGAESPTIIVDLSLSLLSGTYNPRENNILIMDVNDDGADDIVYVAANSIDADIAFIIDTVNQTVSSEILYEPFTMPATLVGVSGGTIRVSESGASTYALALATPAGTAGVSPQLSLSYNSQGRNGLVGLGWSLSGLSSITRCRQTLTQDNNSQAITWTNTDRFCLDGQRLMLISGSYGESNSVYKTEVESFTKVTAFGGTSGNPGYFKIEKKDGSVSYYGDGGNASEIAHNGKTFAWAQNEYQDNVGNAILYIYAADVQNGFRIQEIRYAFGPARNDYNFGKASIIFNYEDRLDNVEGYFAGYKTGIKKRLNRIDVTNNGQVVRNYHLGYRRHNPADLDLDQLSRLAHIQECVGNECLKPERFSWAVLPAKPNFLPSTSSFDLSTAGNSNKEHGASRFGDVNGDGKLDIVIERVHIGSEHSYHFLEYRLSANDGTSLSDTPVNENPWSLSLGETKLGTDRAPNKWSLIDYNNDGRSDVITYHKDIGFFNVYLSKYYPVLGDWRLSGVPITVAQGVQPEESHTFVDINGDGLLDAVSTSAYWLLERDSSQAVDSKTPYHFGSKNSLAWSGIVPRDETTCSGAGEDVNRRSFRGFGDFNGDGVTDVIGHDFNVRNDIQDPRPWVESCTSGSQITYILIRNGNALENYYRVQSPAGIDVSEEDLIQVVDFNGDNLPDLFFEAGGSFYYQINNGAGFDTAQSFTSFGSNPRDFQFVDYNSDGFVDVAYKSNTGKYSVAIWNNNQFGNHYNYFYANTNDNEEYYLVDLSNDGRLDMLHLHGIYGDLMPSEHQAEVNNVITAFTNGLSNTTKIDYQALNHSDHYRQVGESCDPGTSCENYINEQILRETLLSPISLLPGAQTLGLTAPVVEIHGPLYVVTKLAGEMPTAHPNNPGSVDQSGSSSIQYFYGEAYAQAGGRGFLGFRELVTLDEETGVRTIDEYRIDFPFIGYALRTEVRSSDGEVLSKAENIWELQDWDATWPAQVIAQGSKFLAPVQPFMASATEITFPTYTDLTNPNKFSAGLTVQQKVVIENQYDDYGNAISTVETTTGGGDTFIASTSNEYGTTIFDKEMGRLSKTTAIHSRTVSGTTQNTTRTSAFSYYLNGSSTECNAGGLSIVGLLCQEIIEPDIPEFKVTTKHIYNQMGNPIRVEVIASGETTRTSRNEYDLDGRYVDRSFNALNQKTHDVISRNDLGLPTEVHSLNGRVAYLVYDELGRAISTSDNSGGSELIRHLSCDNINCPVGAVQAVEKTVSGGGKTTVFIDKLARTIREGKISFDGQWSYSDTEYDHLGRAFRKSEAFYGGSLPQNWVQTEYDNLGRVIRTISPNNSESTITYNGLLTTISNDLGHNKAELKNAKGELIEVIDNLGTKINYEYDVRGNLLFVKTDNQNDLTISLTYDLLGQKKSMNDPDKGDWQYFYTKFGELESQIDAKGQSVANIYDVLGRVVDRVDRRSNNTVENHTRWYYDGIDDQGNAVPNSIGQVTAVIQSTNTNHAVCSSSSTEYCERFEYDDIGRASATNIYLGSDGAIGSYRTRVDYDSIGRVNSQFDVLGGVLETQTNGAPTSGIINSYNYYGYLNNISDIATGDLLYQVESTDARGNITAERLANQAVTNLGYNAQTGLLETQTANLSGIVAIQNINYDWDTVGNLISRRNRSTNPWTSQNQDRQESFCYDSLNRLIKTRKNTLSPGCASLTVSEQDLQYDNLGNITYKQNVGNYNYSQNNAGPHAVTSTSDGVTYAYDANGSMTSDSSGRNLLYTTFDKPYQIIKGSHQIDFKYGPDRSRYQRIDTNGSSGEVTTTQYLGGIEKVTKSDAPNQIEWKRYLPGGAMYTVTTSVLNEIHTIQSTDKTVLYKDHLGSTDVITDITGNVLHAMSFDPWGERRDGWTWDQLTVNELVNYRSALIIELGAASETTKGFTGHEMMDEVGLIHMNGRIYDPKLARFLQADSIVQAATDTQLYNRYSYVRNNPLNATDPSGYEIVTIVGLVVYGLTVAGVITEVWIGALIIAAAAAIDVLSSGGDIGEALVAAFTSFALTYAGGQIGAGFSSGEIFTNAIAFGVIGGVGSMISGGSFGDGFKGAGIGALLGGAVGKNTRIGRSLEAGGRALARIVIGGTASKASGGKFANGAAGAAFRAIVSVGPVGLSDPATEAFVDKSAGDYTAEDVVDVIESTKTGKNAFDAAKPRVVLDSKKGAYFSPKTNTIHLRVNASLAVNVRSLAHELGHAYQSYQGINNPSAKALSRGKYISEMITNESMGDHIRHQIYSELANPSAMIRPAGHDAWAGAKPENRMRLIENRFRGPTAIYKTSTTGQTYGDYYGVHWDRVNK